MEHIIKRELGGGIVELKAEKGYKLFSLLIERVVSEAVVKEGDEKNFVAINE